MTFASASTMMDGSCERSAPRLRRVVLCSESKPVAISTAVMPSSRLKVRANSGCRLTSWVGLTFSSETPMALPISLSNCQPRLSLPFFVTIVGTSRHAATGLDEQHAGQLKSGWSVSEAGALLLIELADAAFVSENPA